MDMENVIIFDTELCADCVECRQDGKVAVGTYQLHGNGEKSGKLYLFQDTLQHTPLSFEADAILDMKWLGDSTLTLATNNRGLGFLTNSDGASIRYSDDSNGQVYLSLDIMNDYIFTSTNQGAVAVYDNQQLVSCFKAHDFETWTVCGNPGRNCVYTGADDSLFKGWDIRTQGCLFVDKSHAAGVCSVSISANSMGCSIVTGSYDKGIRLWDDRMIANGPLNSLFVNSGAWRLKWIGGGKILAACMHDGFYVLDASSLSILDHRNFGSLSYGCSSIHDTKIFTCSFYNKQAQEWDIKVTI